MALGNTDVLTALARVQHPTLGRDLVSLGLVKSLAIDGGRVRFTLGLPAAAPPVQERVVTLAREAVQRVPGVRAVEIATADAPPPGAPGQPAAAGPGHGHGPAPNLAPTVRHVVAVGAGKGGVGKSTVAVNLAVALAQDGLSVGVMDGDVYGPSVPTMLGLADWKPPAGGVLAPPEAHGVKCISLGFFLDDPDQPVIWRGPMIHKYVQQFLGVVEWGALDVLIVDLPPGTGDVQLTLAQSVPLAGGVVVCTPQDVALLDARKAVRMFQKLNAPVLGMVENMAGFVCGHCGEVTDVFGRGGVERASADLQVPFLGRIPLDPRVVVGGDAGTPALVGAKADDPVAQAFRAVAHALVARLQAAGPAPAITITR
jgi:ATP-binding protein involved in chromosome partitioning